MKTRKLQLKGCSLLNSAAIGILLIIAVPELSFAQKAPKEVTSFPALNKVQMPDVKQVTLRNGMRVYLVEDHEYPTVDMRAMVRTGSIYDPADKIGLASITGTVLRTGGTTTHSGDEIDKTLETMGAYVETGIEQSSGYVAMSVLKADADKGIAIMADVLMHPAFAENKIDLAKVELRSGISRRNDNIWDITGREFNSLIYGKAHPYARYPEYATVDSITRDDITAFYEKYFHPNNIVLAVWGDFKSKDMQKKLEAAFGEWTPAKTEYPEQPKVDYRYRYTINFVQKPDVNQSHIQMGHIGGVLSDPDYPALVVMNQILSNDRMFKVLRTKEGLTYAPWGYYGSEYDHPGVFNCGTQTKSQSTVYAIRLMLNEVKKMTEEPVTDEELQRAKDSYLNSFVFNFDSKSKIVTRLMTYAYYGYPLDFIDKLKDGVEKVTSDDVLRAAKAHLHPGDLQILVVGNKDDFGEPLSSLGDVNEIDITIPEPPTAAAPEATSESLAKGRELFLKSMTASGGSEAFHKIKNVRVTAKILRSGEGGDMEMGAEITLIYPDRLHQAIKTSMGEIKMVMAGEKGWMVTPQGKMPMQESVMKQLRGDIFREASHFFTHADELKIQSLGEKEFAGVKSLELLVSSGEELFHLYLDPQTYLPTGVSYRTTGREGPVEVQEYWSDYREVDQVKLPHKSIATVDGKKVSEATVIEMKHNVEVDPKMFEEE
ncbi:MAG: insulinase family protein [Bacteroidetes bacterium]|nr:insulinase family protein [Bacteroidota bacterium]